MKRTNPWTALIFSSLLLMGCNLTNVDIAPASHQISATDRNTWTDALKTRRDIIKTWATKCAGTGWISEKRNGECYEWDTHEFGAMGCLAAKLANDFDTASLRCQEVENSQISSGRWFRGQQTKQVEDTACATGDTLNCPKKDAFSRDAVNGLLSYWTATRNSDSAVKWFNWFSSHQDLNGKKVIERSCDRETTNSCEFVPSSWALLNKAWTHMGLAPSPKMLQVSLSDFFDEAIYNSSLPFDRSLAATGVVLHRVWNQWSSPAAEPAEKAIVDGVANKLYNYDRKNAYLYFVAKGPDQTLINLILDACPVVDPGSHGPNGDAVNFIWQGASDDWIYKHPMGHDCIFLMNMVIAALHPEATGDPLLVYHW